MDIAHFFVKPEGIPIFPGDQGVEHLIALGKQYFFQSGVEGGGDAPALGLRPQVYRRLGAPPLGRPGVGGTCVGVAQNFPLFLPNKPGKLGGYGVESV